MGKKAALLAVALAVAGLCILLWPVVSGHRLQADMSAAAQGFLEEARQSYPELLADLQGYNQRIYTERQAGLADAAACEEPAVLLRDYGVEDEIIGVLEIPALELVMPVYLGASDSHLAAGAAVLGNTSAPIGGMSTNCVVAGHRGWYGADYFRHIDRLQAGDTVTITSLWETLTYAVVDMKIIQPDQVDKIKIQPGRDLLTLITCHPYASGGRQRLVVYTLELNLCKGDGTEENWSYHLNAAEQEVLARKMEAFCQQQTGTSLHEYAQQLRESGSQTPEMQM